MPLRFFSVTLEVLEGALRVFQERSLAGHRELEISDSFGGRVQQGAGLTPSVGPGWSVLSLERSLLQLLVFPKAVFSQLGDGREPWMLQLACSGKVLLWRPASSTPSAAGAAGAPP